MIKKIYYFFDDLTGADILDIFIHRMERLPNPNELLNLEKKFFLQKSNSYRKKIALDSEDIFKKNNINHIYRSNLYCDYLNKKCDLIKDNEKIYSDEGHLTDNGAKYFSKKGRIIIKKLTE